VPGAGDCFWVETNNQDGVLIGHLFVLLLDPEKYTQNTIIIPVDTLRSDKQDKTTILDPGDHDFITARSFLNYSRAKIYSIKNIEQMIKDGKAKLKPPMKSEILCKIIDGLRKSDHTPQEVLTMYGYYIMDRLAKDAIV
jgi:hypothetical protein